MDIEFGLDTFGDITRGADGELLTGAQTIRNVVEQAEMADRVGVASDVAEGVQPELDVHVVPFHSDE